MLTLSLSFSLFLLFFLSYKLLQFEFYIMFIYGEHCKKDYNKKKSFNVNVIFRACYLMLSLRLLVSVAANETPQQVVTKRNNYKAICNGLGYKKLGCKGSEMHFSIWYLELIDKHMHCSLQSDHPWPVWLCRNVIKNRFPTIKILCATVKFTVVPISLCLLVLW